MGRGREDIVLAAVGAALIGLLLAACGGGSTGGTASKAGGPIVIGATYEETGPVPPLGAEAAGAQAAAKYLNAHGGVLGRKIKLVVEDNAGSPSQAISELRQFAPQGINIVLGGALGTDCTAEAPVAIQLKQVVICGSTDNLPSNDQNMFAVGPGFAPTYGASGALIGRFAKKAAMFSDLSADGSDTVVAGTAGMRAVGVTPIVERYPVTATTFTPEIQAAISQGAQALWFTACAPTALTAVAEAESLGFKGKMVLENCLASYQIAQSLKGLAGTHQQILVLSPYSLLSAPAPDPAERAAITLYESQIPGPVNTVVSAGWDSMMVAAKAIEKAHSTTTAALLATLSNHFSFTGVWQSGTYTTGDHRGARLAGYAVPTYFTSAGTIAPLP